MLLESWLLLHPALSLSQAGVTIADGNIPEQLL
jgi:hypothetical protein